MQQMTSRQRIKAAIAFEPTDRLPCSESLWPDTLASWREQGMPADVDPVEFFDLDICSMALDCSPRYEQKIINRDDPWYTYEDRWGYTATKKIGAASSVHFFDHKTTDKSVWEATKRRWALDDNDPQARIDTASYFEHFDPYPTWAEAQQKFARLRAADRYILADVYGPWEATWRHCGYEEMLMNLALEPDWVTDMAACHIDLAIAVLQRSLNEGITPDGLFMIEDLAETRGMLFSPDTWRTLYKPHVARLGEFLAAHNIDFWIHCCGNCEAVFADLIECGIRVINPLQATAGLDAPELRQKYGKNVAFYGGISVPKMSGPLDELTQELEHKVALVQQGGYIFHSDHSIPPDVEFERYQWILKTARDHAQSLL